MTAQPANLLAQLRRRTKYVAAGCGVGVIGTLAWALVPTHPAVIGAPSFEVASAATDLPPPAPLDVKAFETPVWTIAAAPQPPPPPPPPPPAPPPLKLQLIGIIKEAEVYKVVIYDPDTNKLFVVASGEAAAGHTVERVIADSITIKDGALVRTLALKTGWWGMTQDLRWHSGHFFWAVLDAPGVRASNSVPEGVLSILQEDLPVPVEDIHAVGAVDADGKLVVCAARRDSLREVPADVLRLSPEDLPAFIEPKIDAAAFNLLVGDFEPASLRKERGRRTAILTAAAVAIACVLSVGLSRRAEAWNRASDQARAASATVTNAYSPTAGPLLMQMELDRLRKAPRGDAKPVMPPDAAAALASLLSLWPKELECQTDSVQVGPTTMSLSLTVAMDARPFLTAIKPPEGWTMDEPRLTSTGDGSRLHLVLHRKEARS